MLLPKKTVAMSLESGQYIDDGNLWHGSPAAKGFATSWVLIAASLDQWRLWVRERVGETRPEQMSCHLSAASSSP
jgi:hypothetical protein